MYIIGSQVVRYEAFDFVVASAITTSFSLYAERRHD
jgi:hypothetical protein